MSDYRSWRKKSIEFTEAASALIRDCVAVGRARGLPTKNALPDLAPALGITPRRARSLFFMDGTPVVLKNEWMSLRYRAGLFFLNEAQRLRKLAERYEEAGEDLVAEQLEFSWEASWDARNCSTERRQRSVA